LNSRVETNNVLLSRVVGGLYSSIAVMDYLRGFMGMHAVDTSWTLDPRQEIGKQYDGQGIPRGVGNQVSVEFNLLYRFHSAISKRDEDWTAKFFNHIFEGKDPATMDITEFMRTLHTKLAAVPANPGDRTFADEHGMPLKRDPVTGKFDDDKLMEVLDASINDPIGAFGARNVPKQLRVVEILGILQARKWQMCSLNEFRKSFGMTPHASFEDINSDKDIQDTLRDLYEHPDMVELYPGLFCEGAGQHMDPGTDCPSELAVWKGVFCDAVTLVRSDRFYTVDWTITTLTSWGMKEVSPNPKVVKGSMMYKLIQRAFPGWYKYNALALWQPMYTPKKNKIYAVKQGKMKDLVDVGPSRPVPAREIKDIQTIQAILKRSKTFQNPAYDEFEPLVGPLGEFMRSMERLSMHIGKSDKKEPFNLTKKHERLFFDYFRKTAQSIEERERCKWVPRTIAGKTVNTWQIDVVRE
jgi:hypothetical protein